MAQTPFSIVCISSQPWRSDLPTNRQQIMLRAARRGHIVLFVETNDFVGWHLARLVRGREFVAAARRIFWIERAAPNIFVRKALNVLPWGQKYDFANRVNAALTATLLRREAARLPRPVVLWIYDPGAARVIGAVGEELAVYDCVDAYEEQAGSDARRRRVIGAGDARAAAAAELVFTTTRTLFKRQSTRNARTHLVPNVGDYEHFRPASTREHASEDVRVLPRPVVGFAGNFLPSKVDFNLLQGIARARPDWTVLLVGPAPPAVRAQLEALRTIPNVHWVGPKPYQEIPRYVAAFDVGVIPYVENEYTRSCFPLKLYEYLAAGKPVVASGVPELLGMEPDVVVAQGDTGFVEAIERALSLRGRSDLVRRTTIAAGNTWETRTERLLDLITAELRD
jgi:glycosyltransferase involved in cell wall biosynthesis